jgi:hypothetical protein
MSPPLEIQRFTSVEHSLAVSLNDSEVEDRRWCGDIPNRLADIEPGQSLLGSGGEKRGRLHLRIEDRMCCWQRYNG